MSATISPVEAKALIKTEVLNRKASIFQETAEVTEPVIDGMVQILANSFLAEIFPPAPQPELNQRVASLTRVNARFNVRADGRVTRAYVLRQMDRFEGRQP